MIDIYNEQDGKKKVKTYAFVKKKNKAAYMWAAEVLGVSFNKFVEDTLNEKVKEVVRTQFK